jgi:hypothetical protein
VAESYEQGDETSGYMKGGNVLHKLRKFCVLKEDSVKLK